MCDKENCNCGSNSCYGDCEPWNCVEQAVNDVWSTKKGQIAEFVDRAETAAENSEASAKASADSAAEAKEFRDEAETAATTAVAAEGIVLGVVNDLQNTANILNNAVAGIAVTSWFYTTVSENQTVIPIPSDKSAADVQSIYIEGARQSPFRGFEFDKTAMIITLAEPLPLGLEIEIILGTYNSDNPNDFASTLASNNGASLVGTASGFTVQGKLDDLSSAALTDNAALYRYKLVKKLPINPPLVASVVSDNGYSYLYPQAFSYGRNGDIFINLSSNGGIATWVAKYNSQGEIVSIFNAFAGTSEVSHFFSEGGVDYYVIGGKGNLHKYDVTNLPAGVSTQTPVSTMTPDVNFGGCGFDGKNRMLLEEQAQPLGKLSVRNRLFVYNMVSGLREQTVTLPFQIVGAYSGTTYENIIHKTQAFAVGKGGVYLAHGKNSTGTEEDVVHATGVSFCNWQGNASATGLITARAMKDFLIEQGLPANRIECEGIAMGEGGFPHILHAYLRNTSDPAAATEGIAITSIGEPFGYTDLSAGAIAPLTATNYGKSKDGLVNPYTGEVMDTMTKILDYMANTDTQEYSFWTGTVTVTDLDGSTFPAFSKVKIYNQNGYSFFYSVVNSNTQSWWIASGSPYTKAYANFVGNGGTYNNFNTLLGLASGRKITTGVSNTILGRIAGQELLTGSGNTFVGQGAGGLSTSCDQTSALGLNAGRWQLDGVTPANYSYCTAIGVGSVLSGNSQVQLGGPTATPYAYAALQIRSDERDKTDFREITSELAEAFVLGLVSYFYKLDLRDDYYEETIEQVGIDEEGQPIYESVRHSIPKDGSKVRNRDHAGYSAQKTKALMDALGIDFGMYQDHLVNGGCDVKTLAYEQSIPFLSKALADEIRRGKERDKRMDELEKRMTKLDAQ